MAHETHYVVPDLSGEIKPGDGDAPLHCDRCGANSKADLKKPCTAEGM